MAIDYAGFAFPKGSRVVAQIKQQRVREAEARRVAAAIRKRDGGRCRRPGCTNKSAHQHHIEYRSKGGQDVTANLVSLCADCHRCVHGGLLTVDGNADKRLRWTVTALGHGAGLRGPKET